MKLLYHSFLLLQVLFLLLHLHVHVSFSLNIFIKSTSNILIQTRKNLSLLKSSISTTNINVNNNIQIEYNSESLAKVLCQDIISIGQKAIQEKGKFYIAIPGGSVLKLLNHLKTHPLKDTIDWSKVYLFYVNHKCVFNNDPTSTHFKAKSIFLDELKLENSFPINDELVNQVNGLEIAKDYEMKLRNSGIPSINGNVIFDYMLLGVGKDGHIGSIYPNRPETNISNLDSLVLHVDKKTPSSISLSLSVMNNAKYIRIVLIGEDKQDAVIKGIKRLLPVYEFPVCGINQNRENLLWIIDEEAAGKLKL